MGWLTERGVSELSKPATLLMFPPFMHATHRISHPKIGNMMGLGHQVVVPEILKKNQSRGRVAVLDNVRLLRRRHRSVASGAHGAARAPPLAIAQH